MAAKTRSKGDKRPSSMAFGSRSAKSAAAASPKRCLIPAAIRSKAGKGLDRPLRFFDLLLESHIVRRHTPKRVSLICSSSLPPQLLLFLFGANGLLFTP